jgi:hypothetical protein
VGAVILALLVSWALATGVAQAQEDGAQRSGELTTLVAQPQESGVQRFRQIVGPYNIRVALVQSGLSLGTTLVAVYVVEEATGQAIPDARVLLRARHENRDTDGIATAHNTQQEPERYDAQMNLDAPGDWQLTIEVDSALGSVGVEVPTLTVEAARRISGGTFVFIGVFLVIIASAAYLWWSTQRGKGRGGPTAWPGDGAGGRHHEG